MATRSSQVIARIHTSALRRELDVVRKSLSRKDKDRMAEITRQLATLGHARGVKDLHLTPSAQKLQKRLEVDKLNDADRMAKTLRISRPTEGQQRL